MSGSGTPPEWPIRPGWTPGRPEPPAPVPVLVPRVDVDGPSVLDRLAERRVFVLAGELDAAAATAFAARLLTADAEGEEPIELRLAGVGADLDAAVLLAETLDLVSAPVRALALGSTRGPALAVLAACADRRAHRHAMFVFAEPTVTAVGTAGELAAEVAVRERALAAVCGWIARACGRRPEDVAADLRRGRVMSAEEARGYGLVTDLVDEPAGRRP